MLALRVARSSSRRSEGPRRGGWHELESEDGPVRLDLGAGRLRARRERRAARRLRPTVDRRDGRPRGVRHARSRGAAAAPRAHRAATRPRASGRSRASRASASTPRSGWRSAAAGLVLAARARALLAPAPPAPSRGAYVLNTALKLAVAPPPPELAGPAAADGHADAAELPERPRDTLLRGRPRLRAAWAPGAPLYALAGGARPLAALPRRALSLGRPRRGAARHGVGARRMARPRTP